MCALMHVLHAIVRGTDESREMVVVLQMLLSLPLSLSLSHTHTHMHTHTSKLEDRSLMYTQVHNISASVYVSLMHDHLHIHTSLCMYQTHTVSTFPFRHNTHMDTYTRSLSVTHTKLVLKKLGRT